MISIAYSPVHIQTSPKSVPALPIWFGEVTIMAHYLIHLGLLKRLSAQVRFARRRFGRYEVIDFVAVPHRRFAQRSRHPEQFTPRSIPCAPLHGAVRTRPTPASLDGKPISRRPGFADGGGLAHARPAGPVARPLTTTSQPPVGLWDPTGSDGWSSMSMGPVSRASACPAADPRASVRSATTRPGLCPRLSRTQTGRGGAHSDHRVAGPHPPVARHVWWCGQWRLPR